MIGIMFVCHGNICRSPMAEFIMKDMLLKCNLTDRITVASSATSSEEIIGGIGNPMYPPARAELMRHGIPFTPRKAVRLKPSDYGNYDLFIGMDSMNIRNMTRILNGDPENKIRKIMDYTVSKGDVADPWYNDRFDIAFRDIYAGCKGLIDTLFPS